MVPTCERHGFNNDMFRLVAEARAAGRDDKLVRDMELYLEKVYTTITKRCARTKTLVSVYPINDAWVVMCEEHGTKVEHTSKSAATKASANPALWCGDCSKT